MPATPPPSLDDAAVEQATPASGKERVLGALGGVLAAGGGRDRSESPLVQAMDKHHQQRISLAQKHYKDFQTYTGILATGIDPDTNEALTDEKKQHYQNLLDNSKEELEKTAGVNKDIKGKLQKLWGLAEHMIKLHPKPKPDAVGGGGGQQPDGAGGGGASPKPEVATGSGLVEGGPNLQQQMAMYPDSDLTRGAGGESGAAAPSPAPSPPSSPSSPRMTPPPSLTASLERNADASRLREKMADQREFANWKRQAQTAHEFKMAEIDEAAKTKGEHPTGTTRSGTPTSMSEARKLAAKGMTFKSAETGDDLDLADYDDTMMLVPLYQGGKVTGYYPASQKQTHLTFNNKVIAVPSLNQMDIPGGAGAELGAARVGTTSGSEQGIDPVTGTTITRRTSTPMAGGPARAGARPTPGGAGGGAGAGAGTGRGAGGAGGHGALLPTAATAKRVTTVRSAATQLFGDPSQPSIKGLKDFASLADKPQASAHVANAVRLTIGGLEQEEKRAGNLLTLLENYGGVPQALVQSQVAIQKDVLSKLSPQEMEAYNATISSFSTIMGLRSLTGASAAKFSVVALERDIPIPGFNVLSSAAFKDKLSRLAEEVWTGSQTVPMSNEDRAYLKKQVSELKGTDAAKGKSRMTPPPKPGAGHPLDDEIRKAVEEAKRAKPAA